MALAPTGLETAAAGALGYDPPGSDNHRTGGAELAPQRHPVADGQAVGRPALVGRLRLPPHRAEPVVLRAGLLHREIAERPQGLGAQPPGGGAVADEAPPDVFRVDAHPPAESSGRHTARKLHQRQIRRSSVRSKSVSTATLAAGSAR